MSKELTPLECVEYIRKEAYGNWLDDELDIIKTALKEKEDNDFELEVFKLAYEWKCNGCIDSYKELLEKARRTVKGWKEIERKGYGTITE